MSLPKMTFKQRPYPKTYIIQHENPIHPQHQHACAAFAAAFVLRHFSIPSEGATLDQHMPHKMNTGHVSPKGITASLKDHGLSVQYLKGSIHTLKHGVSLGHPVIVFMKAGKNDPTLHYAVVVGYDESYLYLADSLASEAHETHRHYNRKITLQEFQRLWNIKSLRMPFYSYTYFLMGIA